MSADDPPIPDDLSENWPPLPENADLLRLARACFGTVEGLDQAALARVTHRMQHALDQAEASAELNATQETEVVDSKPFTWPDPPPVLDSANEKHGQPGRSNHASTDSKGVGNPPMNHPDYPHSPQYPGQPQPARPVQPGQPVRPAQIRPAQPIQPGAARPLPPGAARPVAIKKEEGYKLREQTPEEKAEEEDLAEEAVRRAPPWLVSVVIHLVLIIVLALWFIPWETEQTAALDGGWSEIDGEQLEDESFDEEVELEEEITVDVESPLEPVVDPIAAPPVVALVPNTVGAVSTVPTPAVGSALDGRTAGRKAALMKKYGGTPGSERAVQLALAWIAKQQKTHGGYWSLSGPYSDGHLTENMNAATAMALLAFQGNGVTHREGKYRENVQKGWEYLLSEQDQATGSFYNGQGASNHRFYTHAQCTIAACEMYGLTGDDTFRRPSELGIKYIVDNQDNLGGWRYEEGNGSDTSVTGWCLMALQSAKMAGLEVPETTLENVGRYLDKAGSGSDSFYAYQVGNDATHVMTAEGLLCRQYLGWGQNDDRLLRGADNLLEQHMPKWSDQDVYYWYYATQMFHHLEGKRWEKWNGTMRDLLVKHQNQTGREAGSWDPLQLNHQGGRLYTTCLCTYCLEVYYRHLPIYSFKQYRQ